METKSTVVLDDSDWSTITRFLPDGWRAKAITLNACRRLRGVPSIDILLRTLLVHISEGYSLIQTANIAKQAGWANLSDVALLKRLRSAEHWLRWMCLELANRPHPDRLSFTKPEWLAAHRVRSFDATVVNEPGSTGTDWRIHYSFGLFDFSCDEFLLTDPGTGEQISNFTLQPGDFVVADRAYCSGKFIKELVEGGADYLLRYKFKSVRLFDQEGQHFDVLDKCRLAKDGVPLSYTLKTKQGCPVRLVILKKSPEAANKARKGYVKEKRKRQKKIIPESLEMQNYIILVTSKTDPAISTVDLLNLYRLRWQIELAFKRMKSLMGLGHLPKYDPVSCRAWLYGKLLTALLVESMVEYARLFSPWGFPLEKERSR